jgi:hypothetical protein
VKVAGFDDSGGPGFFLGLAFGGLAVGEASLGSSLRKGPLATAIGVHQQELSV